MSLSKAEEWQCDTDRPICGRCRKASRSCTWESNEEILLPFRSENAFAQGKPRRPRKHPGDENGKDSMTMITPPSQVSASLSFPVELQAFNYWIENFTAWPNDLVDFGHEYCTHALRHWNHTQPDSGLHLAVSSFSLAVFGQAKRCDKALQAADKFYARWIIRARGEIEELSEEKIDELLIATMLMAGYDVRFRLGCCNTSTDSYVEPCVSSRETIQSASPYLCSGCRWHAILEENLPLQRNCESIARSAATEISTKQVS